MEECAVIEIFGTAQDGQTLETLAVAAEKVGLSVDWIERMREDEIIDAMFESADRGEWLRLVKDESGCFNEVLAACRKAGLSYIHTRGISGDEGYHTAYFWKPGWEKEFECGLVNGITIGVPLEDIQSALQDGNDTVRALVAFYEEKTLANVDKSLKLPPEVRIALGDTDMTV